MPYALNQNDIIQVTVVTTMPDIKKCLNVLHYRYKDVATVTDGWDAIYTFLQTFANTGLTTSYASRWKALASDQAMISEVWGQKVFPVRYGKVIIPQTIVGAQVEDPLPGLNQFNIVKKGDIAARYAVGGVRIPGLGEELESSSQLNATGLPLANQLAIAVRSEITDTALRTWKPVIYRRGNPGSSVDVVETSVNPVISSQRTRIAFRGI